MITKQQLIILSVFEQNLFIELTFRQIKEQSRQKSNNVIQIALKQFLNEGLIKAKQTGDVNTYSLNLNNLTYSYLNLINELNIKEKKIPSKILDEIKLKVSRYTPFFILLVFGSYAKGKANPKSDLDIAIIVESQQTKKEITPFLETIKRREILRIDYHLFTVSEFQEMLKSEQENVGKELFRGSIIYIGAIPYYNIICSLKNENPG
jgi:predicted nucleotidyltransferase